MAQFVATVENICCLKLSSWYNDIKTKDGLPGIKCQTRENHDWTFYNQMTAIVGIANRFLKQIELGSTAS